MILHCMVIIINDQDIDRQFKFAGAVDQVNGGVVIVHTRHPEPNQRGVFYDQDL